MRTLWIAGVAWRAARFGGERISRQSVLWSIHEIPSIIRTAQNALHLRCYAENQCRPGSYPVDSAIVTRGARFVGWPLLRWNFFEPQLTSIPRRAAVNGREVDANDSCPLGRGVPWKRLQGSRAFFRSPRVTFVTVRRPRLFYRFRPDPPTKAARAGEVLVTIVSCARLSDD
jgi:hypothetical protein